MKKKEKPELKLFKPTELRPKRKLKMVLYGDTGIGKSYFAFNHGIKTLGILTESEQTTLTLDDIEREEHSDTRYVLADSMEKLKAAIELASDFDLVVLDNMSDIARMILDNLPLYCFQKEGQSDRDMLAIAGYKPWKKRLQDAIFDLLAVPSHVLIVAHDDVRINDIMAESHEPRGPGKGSGKAVVEKCNAAAYMGEKKDGTKYLQFVKRGGAFISKQPRRFKKYEKPDLELLIKKIEGEKQNG